MKKSKIIILLLVPVLLLSVFFINKPVFAEEPEEPTETETKEDAKKKAEEEAKKKAAEEAKKKADAEKRCKAFVTDDAPLLAQAYGMSLDYDMDKHHFVIHLDKSAATGTLQKAAYNEAKFKIEWISVIDIDGDYNVLSEKKYLADTNEFKAMFGNFDSKLLTSRNDLTFNAIDGNVHRYQVRVKTTGGYVDPAYKASCGGWSTKDLVSWITLEMDYFGEAYYTSEVIDTEPLSDAKTVGRIDCGVQHKKDSFEYLYCRDIDNARKAGVQRLTFTTENNTYEKLARSRSFDNPIPYHCDPFKALTDVKTSLSEKYKYTNTNYLWGIINYEIPAGEYLYNKGGQDSKGQSVDSSMVEHETVTCTVQCEEIVTVEYGPPVAAKAGFCFDYQIKVTSRVNCSITQPPQKPKVYSSYCTPSPGCNHGNGYVDPAAGPNEDFHACISSCDGGKYSKKCSLECYNQVYKGITIRNNMSYSLYQNVTASPLGLRGNNTQDRTDMDNVCKKDENGQYTYGKYYYSPKHNAILWTPSSTLGRWYCENNYGGHACVKTSGEGGGISAVCGCSAVCRWNGCINRSTGKVDVYLNPGEASRDYEKNKTEYKRVLAECEAYAKCSTTQAEFSIDVDYTYNKDAKKEANEKTVTIHFPYTANNARDVSDKIQYHPDQKSVTCTTSNQNSVIISSDGCYKCAKPGENDDENNKSSTREYQTEWGFPTTWLESKTGEVSYEPQASTGWIKKTRRFCIPNDSININQKWWNIFYINTIKEDSRFSYSENSATDCHFSSCSSEKLTFTQIDADRLKYNIRGKARKFGLLEWNIDISCFYAINDSFPQTEDGTPTCTFDDTKCPDSNIAENRQMRIRSVDLANLFPAEDGTMLTSSDVSGRTPGFNWSAYATNVAKDPDYTSRPSFYMAWVQSHGNSIYSPDYLDYEINLSKEDIRQLKKQDRNFTEYKGSIIKNSVSTYMSDLFRGNNATLTNVKVPSEQALKCNNIKNNSSSECEDFQR